MKLWQLITVLILKKVKIYQIRTGHTQPKGTGQKKRFQTKAEIPQKNTLSTGGCPNA